MDLFLESKRFIDACNYHRHHQGLNHAVPSMLHLWSAIYYFTKYRYYGTQAITSQKSLNLHDQDYGH